MIKVFQEIDLQGAQINPHSIPHYFDVKSILLGEEIKAYTVWDKERPVAFFGYLEYAPTKYDVAIILTKAMKPSTARCIKQYMENKAQVLKATRAQTTSVNNKTLERWHKFLGFEFEGVRKRFVGDIDYAMWGRTWV